MLEEKGYIGAIRNAMMIFKNEKIAGKPIHVAFLTGGASRMDFIKDLGERNVGAYQMTESTETKIPLLLFHKVLQFWDVVIFALVVLRIQRAFLTK